MGHIHSVYDTDNHFKVDGITRAISDVSSKKTSLVQCDHNSERFTFEIPRYIEGHDMLTCNSVSVRYRNGASGGTTKGKYVVKDFQVSPADENVVICSWLISKNATKYVGPLKFQLRFECISSGTTPDYVWSTGVFPGITVQESFDEFDVEESEGDTGDDDDGGGTDDPAVKKLDAPVIRLVTSDDPDDGGDEPGGDDTGSDDTEENTPAILGVAILGRTILGKTDGYEPTITQLTAPSIRIETEDEEEEPTIVQLTAPSIKLETVVYTLDAPEIDLVEV